MCHLVRFFFCRLENETAMWAQISEAPGCLSQVARREGLHGSNVCRVLLARILHVRIEPFD